MTAHQDSTSAGPGRIQRSGLPDGRIKHGMHDTPEHYAWRSMKYRCGNPKSQRYGRYGARGITVCERWLASFEAFYEDMGPRPSKVHSLDRIDNDKGYEPDNVRWATRAEQNRNRGDNVILDHDGRRMTVAEWARELGMNCRTLACRLETGMSAAEALTTPVAPRQWAARPVLLEHDGKCMTIGEWAKHLGVKRSSLKNRLDYGWTVADVLTRPFHANRKQEGPLTLEYGGRRMTLSRWEHETGIAAGTLRIRIKLGWSTDAVLTTPVDQSYGHRRREEIRERVDREQREARGEYDR